MRGPGSNPEGMASQTECFECWRYIVLVEMNRQPSDDFVVRAIYLSIYFIASQSVGESLQCHVVVVAITLCFYI